MSEKSYYEIGYKIFLLNEVEIQLLKELDKNNLLKFSPRKIEVYGVRGEEND